MEIIKKRNPDIFLSLSLRFAKEYFGQLCDVRKKYGEDGIQESKELTIHHRALWTALIVEIRKLFGVSFKKYKNYSLLEIDFFKVKPYKKIINSVYGNRVIQKILKTSNTFTIHLGKNKEEIFPVDKICDSDLKKILEQLQKPIDAFEKSSRS